MSTPTPEAKLRALFEAHATRVLAYCHRHVGPNVAQDIVSDVFLVAWRRVDEVPEDALPWLLVVARNTIGNQRRGSARQRRVAELAAFERSTTVSDSACAGDIALERRTMLEALAGLSRLEREAVLLTAWDGLSLAQAAAVAGCSRRALELRLHRARHRLRRVLDAQDDVRSHRPSPARLDTTQETTP